MLHDGIIRASTSQWNAPLLVVLKKADSAGKPKLRIVIDFRKLNDLTIGDSFPLPNIEEILDQLGNAKYFSTLDLALGYHQIPMAEHDKPKTAFSTPYGHYEYNRMPFGLKNAPATFQRLMNSVLIGIQRFKCLVYLDDIVIYGSSLEEHTVNKRLTEVLQCLQEANLKLQPDKCEFLRKEVNYLGHVISENGISPDPAKLQAIRDFPEPQKVKDVQSFIDLAGYYRKFIKEFSKIAKPLTKLTKKTKKFAWAAEQQIAFNTLKEKLTTAPVLQYPDFTKEFNVTTDASDAIGAVLSLGPIGNDRPIAYASRILNCAEQNYSTTVKELLAIVWAVKHFRPYVYGTKLKIAGRANANADALIRNVKREAHVTEATDKVLALNEDGKHAYISNEDDKEEDNKCEQACTEEQKKQILYEYHDAPTGGHQGIERTIKRIRLKHNWPGLTADVERYVKKCELCQKNKLSRRIKAPLVVTDTPSRPFEKCALDIVGPLTLTKNDNRYLLTFQDHLTKFSKAIPIPNQEANTVSKEFVTKIVLEYGTPEYDQTDWDEWIPYAMHTYNTTPHTATGYTPFELIYGRQAELPTALTKQSKPTYNYDDYAQELRERLRAANRVARENIKEGKVKAKTQYDKRTKETKFEVGKKMYNLGNTKCRGRTGHKATVRDREITHHPGIYFEKIGILHQVESSWKVIIKVDATSLTKRLTQLEKYVHKTDNLCQTIAVIGKETCTNLHEIIKKGFERTNNLIERINATYKRQTAQKRGLVDGIGSVAKSLFDATDKLRTKLIEDEKQSNLHEHFIIINAILADLKRDAEDVLEYVANVKKGMLHPRLTPVNEIRVS
ncbi:uncharacterized protein LOC118647760 [Monomorium pharaonis]|uniref:uncharacterized protein LOC118647760 n=1 Tax=Monomorium pharaonis TaxID=307658 RepID=UPI001746F6B0|nr:uncharacterized protein LOC118647760 [Monomorium pharaonis]